MSIKAKNNVGGALKKAIIVADIANEGNLFNFFAQNDIETIISELGKGRKHFENKNINLFF